MMTVEIVKRMKVKKIDLDKADVVKREVCSRDEVKHVGMYGNGACSKHPAERKYTFYISLRCWSTQQVFCQRVQFAVTKTPTTPKTPGHL